MSRPTIDPKRTGVKAQSIDWTEPPLEVFDDKWFGPPGAMIRRQFTTAPPDGIGYLIFCPGCGQAGSARDGAKWSVTSGSLDDVTTLTLAPSIAKSCCGWHGYLTNGVFQLER